MGLILQHAKKGKMKRTEEIQKNRESVTYCRSLRRVVPELLHQLGGEVQEAAMAGGGKPGRDGGHQARQHLSGSLP